MEFDENNGSQVEQSGTCDVGDEIPPQAIRRMGVGFILPIEEPLVAEGEGQCSTQVEPSPTQDPHASEEQSEGPQPHEQDQGKIMLKTVLTHQVMSKVKFSPPSKFKIKSFLEIKNKLKTTLKMIKFPLLNSPLGRNWSVVPPRLHPSSLPRVIS